MPTTLDWLKRRPRLYWLLRRGRAAVFDLLPPANLDGVPGRVHRNDMMMPRVTAAHAAGYNWSGEQAGGFVADAVAHTRHAGPPMEGLDLGCGHGRVLRHLVRRFSETRWTACDIDRSALRFCAREFGALPVRSSPDIAAVEFPTAPFDVAWMGSLLTHLDEHSNAAVVSSLARNSHNGTVITFSTHGPALVEELAGFGPGMGSQRDEVERSMESRGFAYVAYPHYVDGSYGISFHTADQVDAIFVEAFHGQIERVDFVPRGWMDRHDLHAFVVQRS